MQRRRPIPLPPLLALLLENSVTERFVGGRMLLERLVRGMRVPDAGCGQNDDRARQSGCPGDRVVALDGQPAILDKLEARPDAEDRAKARMLRGGLGEGALNGGGFDRVVMVMIIGEVRDRASALRELYAARPRPPGSGSRRGSAVSPPTR